MTLRTLLNFSSASAFVKIVYMQSTLLVLQKPLLFYGRIGARPLSGKECALITTEIEIEDVGFAVDAFMIVIKPKITPVIIYSIRHPVPRSVKGCRVCPIAFFITLSIIIPKYMYVVPVLYDPGDFTASVQAPSESDARGLLGDLDT